MTLVAQILNFLILVALLRWLAYKPVVRMLEARENRIADSIQRADDDAAKAEQVLKDYKAKLAAASTKAQEIQRNAEARAEEYLAQRKAATENEIEQMKKAAKAEIQRDRERAVEELKGQMVMLSMAAAGKIISKNLDAKENEQLIGDFVSQLDKSKIGDLSC
jgi:F-type H+-transporting ATPase subunit b